MNILAYDSSGEVLSVGLFRDAEKIAQIDSPLFTRHSATLSPTLDIILRSHKLKPADIDYVLVGLGPGSFTGLRVGITTAKVFAYSLGAKLVGVSSLDAAAYNFESREGTLVMALDARKDQLYAAVYEIGAGRVRRTTEPLLTDIKTLLKKVKRPALFAGSGAELHRDQILSARPKKHEVCIDPELYRPRASTLLKAAMPLIQKKKFMDPFLAAPLYIHPKDCNAFKK